MTATTLSSQTPTSSVSACGCCLPTSRALLSARSHTSSVDAKTRRRWFLLRLSWQGCGGRDFDLRALPEDHRYSQSPPDGRCRGHLSFVHAAYLRGLRG